MWTQEDVITVVLTGMMFPETGSRNTAENPSRAQGFVSRERCRETKEAGPGTSFFDLLRLSQRLGAKLLFV